MTSEPLTVDVETAARMLGISRGLAFRCARDGSLPGVLALGRRYVVSRAALMAALGQPEEKSEPTSEPSSLRRVV